MAGTCHQQSPCHPWPCGFQGSPALASPPWVLGKEQVLIWETPTTATQRGSHGRAAWHPAGRDEAQGVLLPSSVKWAHSRPQPPAAALAQLSPGQGACAATMSPAPGPPGPARERPAAEGEGAGRGAGPSQDRAVCVQTLSCECAHGGGLGPRFKCGQGRLPRVTMADRPCTSVLA